MEMRLRIPVTRGYFFLLGALHLVNAALPRTISIDKKKYPLEPRVILLAGVGDTGTTDNSINTGMNTVFIPLSTTRDLLQQQQPRAPGSPDVVSLREGLGTSDGPTSPPL